MNDKELNQEYLRKTGIENVGKVPWGTHFCQFYQNQDDLISILVPYFKAGLENNEFCMWITAEPLMAGQAEQALRKEIPGLDAYIKNGQIEILDYNQWYTVSGRFDSERVLQGWVLKEKQALQKGFAGLRLTGNTFWLEKKDWKAFVSYEEAVNSVIGRYRMLAACTYAISRCNASEIIDVISNHQFTIIKRDGKWELIESANCRQAQEAVKKSEGKYRSLFENMADGFAYNKVILDKYGEPVDFIFLEGNDAFETLTGLKRKEIIGKRVTEVLPGIEKAQFDWIGRCGRVALTGESTRFEQYADFLQRWYSVSAYSPEPGYFVVVFEDITGRKKTEDSLRERETRLSKTEEIAQLGSWELDLVNNRLFWSNETYRIFGLKSQEFVATYEAFLEVVHPDDRAAVDAAYSSSLSAGKDTYEIEHRIVRKSTGEIRVVYEKCEHIRNESGRVIRSAGMVHDITEQKLVEDKIKKSEKKFKAIFESIPSGILVLDKNRNIKEVNNVLERIFDIPREAIINKRWGDAFMCVNSAGHCEKGAEEFCRTCRVRNAIMEVLAGERIYQSKTKVELALNGKIEERILLISASPIEYENEPHAIVMLEDVTELNRLRQRLKAEHTFAGLVGRDAKMQELYDNVRELSEINVPVLINGESGTGKELVASAIHSESPRADKQFVPVNCGALPDGLLESELFGHVKGAFTGAIRDKKGRFELANGGTIFLDEVGDLSPAMQVKLLRVLQDGCFEKVGGEKTIKVDVRVVSATNKSLKDEIKSGRFREDLYYRLSVFPVNITPLRERLNDIALLSECFLRKSAEESGRDIVSLSEEALSVLMDYHWPGNVRELQNALLFALVKCRGRMIEPRHLPLNIQQSKGAAPVKKSRKHKLDLQKVKDALKQTNGNREKSAKILGVSRATMHRFLHDCKDQLLET
ncbi:MAG: sigma 54-interacting transcriptional regulator [Planctomycetes bacterium]|nr:sigma 54-interacting transcriptional regulator [Planctomycetota bacterium]